MKRHHTRLGTTLRAATIAYLVVTGQQCFSIRTAPRFETYIVDDSVDLQSMRVALVPTSLPPDIENPEPVVLLFDSLIEHNMGATGWDFVPAQEYRTIWTRLTVEAGGFFDPFTGERDEPKYAAGVRQLIKEIHERFDPDAFLYPELWVVEAPLRGDFASWDGISQRVWPTPSNLASVYALSFVVVIEDSAGTELFVNGHGLEVMEGYDLNTNEMVMLPRDELFRREALYAAAVAETLRPLLALQSQRP